VSPDRDRIIEQALKHELRGAIPPAGPACLDAETLGAWTDGGLDPAAMASAETHVSTCARCQAMVGAFARANAAVAPAVEAPSFPLWKWWLAPLAAGAAAVTLWMVVPPQRQIATAPTMAESSQPQTAAPAEPVFAPVPAPPAPAAASAPARSSAEDRGRVARADRAEAPAELAANARDNRQFKDQAELKKETAPQAMQERAAAAEAVALSGVQAPAAPAASAARPAELEKNARLAAPPLPPGEDITDRTSPSPLVSWYVGRAGLVILTTDGGKTFTKVNLSEPLDLATVTASDAKNATVVTTTGRRFRTDDSGRTWRPI
jgi:hypothetical protein